MARDKSTKFIVSTMINGCLQFFSYFFNILNFPYIDTNIIPIF